MSGSRTQSAVLVLLCFIFFLQLHQTLQPATVPSSIPQPDASLALSLRSDKGDKGDDGSMKAPVSRLNSSSLPLICNRTMEDIISGRVQASLQPRRPSVDAAIAVYLDINVKFALELSWLYSSWLLNCLEDEFDLVVYANPEMLKRDLPKHPGIRYIETKPMNVAGSAWEKYGFINNYMMGSSAELRAHLASYRRLLKTDLDVFLTRSLAGLKADKILLGYGGYMSSLYPRNANVFYNLTRVMHDVKAVNSYLNHIGPSWLGPREFVLDTLALQVEYCRYLLDKEFPPGTKDHWPQWSQSVLALYAGHMAVNKKIEEADGPSSVVWGVLDVYSFLRKPIDATVMLIHAVHHNGGHFSKHTYYNDAHEKARSHALPCDAPPPQEIADHCLYIVLCAEQFIWSPVRRGMAFVNGKTYSKKLG